MMSHLDQWKHKCIYIVEQVEQLPYAKHFLNPVDEVNDSAAGYYDAIVNPMNIKQLKAELVHDIIKSPQEFVSKFNLIWLNCFEYNGQKHPISLAAKKLRYNVMSLVRSELADGKFNNRVDINPGIRRSNRLRKEMNVLVEQKEKESTSDENHEIINANIHHTLHPDVNQEATDIHLQNKQYMNQIIKNEYAEDVALDLPPHVVANPHALQNADTNANDHRTVSTEIPLLHFYFHDADIDPISDYIMPPLEPDDAKPLRDPKDKIYQEQIEQLKLTICELSQEVQSLNQQKQDMKAKHSMKMKKLTCSYMNLLMAFKRLNSIINDINASGTYINLLMAFKRLSSIINDINTYIIAKTDIANLNNIYNK